MKTLTVLSLLCLSLLLALGCGSEDGAPAPVGSAPQASAPAPGGGQPGTREVSLDPLPLSVVVPEGTMGAMNMSLDGAPRSVTVDIGGGRSLNISEGAGSLDEVKARIAGDTIMFPFRSWAREDANGGIYAFEATGGSTGYHGFRLIEIAGTRYLCKTTGLDGHPSAEVVEEQLRTCAAVQPRS
jgi:hypothetical protein